MIYAVYCDCSLLWLRTFNTQFIVRFMLVIVTAHYTVIMDRLTLILEYKLYWLLWLLTIDCSLVWLWIVEQLYIKALFYYFNLCNVG